VKVKKFILKFIKSGFSIYDAQIIAYLSIYTKTRKVRPA